MRENTLQEIEEELMRNTTDYLKCNGLECVQMKYFLLHLQKYPQKNQLRNYLSRKQHIGPTITIGTTTEHVIAL